MIGMLRAIVRRIVGKLIERRFWITAGPGPVQVYCDQELRACLDRCTIARQRRGHGHIHDSTRQLTEPEAKALGGTFCVIRARGQR